VETGAGVFEGWSGTVSIERHGRVWSGIYAVADGILSVLAEGEKKILDLTDAAIHPELLARYLLTEIVDDLIGPGEP
jgi:hypothetical protein